MSGVQIAGEGTSEDVWRRWSRRFPALTFTGCARLVVVAPHPDDEVLGVGGLLALAAARGIAVTVVAVTDGDASHPGSPTLSPAALRARRPAESAAALAVLGLPAPAVRLGIPDGAVAAHEGLVAQALQSLLGDEPAHTWCLATWRGDGHPDHEATGRAAASATAAAGARLSEYPVWTWHWAVPDDPRVPWARARRIDLPAPVLTAKAAAVQCFQTQIAPLSDDPRDAPVLPDHVLRRLLRSHEVVFG